VVDVLRATATIVEALAVGYPRVITAARSRRLAICGLTAACWQARSTASAEAPTAAGGRKQERAGGGPSTHGGAPGGT
jgi:hypothetical protein